MNLDKLVDKLGKKTSIFIIFAILIVYFLTNSNFLEKNNKDQSHYEGQVKGRIVDPDGWSYLRKTPSLNGEIIRRIPESEFFYVIKTSKNDKWYKIKTSLNETGYIYYNRIRILK